MRKKIAAALGAVIAVLLLASGQVAVAAPQKASPPTINYVSLGDSYSSGTGAGDYQPGTEGTCWRSANSYSELLARSLQSRGVEVNFTNAACSGAKISDMRQAYKSQPPQLNALRPDTQLVTLNIGGNDMGFAPYAQQCLTGDCSGAPTAQVLGRLPGIAKNLNQLLGEIKARSPKATIVLVGYGRPMANTANAADVTLDPICGTEYFSAQERQDGAEVSSGLDLMLRATAAFSRFEGVRVKFVSPFINSLNLAPAFQGHSLCEQQVQYYHGFSALGDPAGLEGLLHWNRLGHAAIASLIRQIVGLPS